MKRIGQTRIEWLLLGVIAVVCAVLSFLQYRWTGEMSRAEALQLRAGLNDQTGRLVRAFNEEIREDCAALLPDAQELRERNTLEAHRIRYEQWISSHDRSLFTRIGIAAPELEGGDSAVAWNRSRRPHRLHGVAPELGAFARRDGGPDQGHREAAAHCPRFQLDPSAGVRRPGEPQL